MKRLLLSLVFVVLYPSFALAGTINFAWDAVTTDTSGAPTTVTGYRLYTSKTSGTYTPPAASDVATTQTSVVINQAGKYYAVATAYNDSGESEYSNEVAFDVVLKPSVPQNFRITSK